MAVYNLEPPACKLIFERCSFNNEKASFKKRIEKKFFNYNVSVLIPDHAQVPKSISNILESDPYWIVKDLPLSILIEREFIEGFVKRGELTLHVTKDVFEELGLEGHVSEFDKKRPRKYVVKVNTAASYFKPGAKNYERVKWCLTDRLGLASDFICVWQPHDDSICPSSLSNYFIKRGYQCPVYGITQKSTQCKVKLRPTVNSASVEETDEHCSYTQFWDWLGGLSLGISEGTPEDYINTLSTPTPHLPMDTCVNSTYTGIISPHLVTKLLDSCRSFLDEASLPWITVTVHGFADSPISWEGWEHGYHLNGDNFYSFVVFPNDVYWLYMASGPHDTFS